MSAPRWARALVARSADSDRADEAVGDLDEAHGLRVERHGRIVGTVLTSLEALDMAFALRWHRRRTVHRLRRTVPPNLPAARRRRMPPFSWLDFKLGLRMLVRYPGMTMVGGAAMALGIAVGAGGLHLVSEVIYPERSYVDPDGIVTIQNVDTRTARESKRAVHDLERWRASLRSVEHLSALRGEQINVAPEGDVPTPVLVVSVSASAFALAPTPPFLGRTLLPADEAPAAPPVVLLSHWLWQSRFAGNPNVVGRVAMVGGKATTVVGVMPATFHLHVPDDDFSSAWGQDAWLPFRLRALDHPEGGGPTFDVFGRLAPGVTVEEARAELATLGSVVAAESPATHQYLVPEVLTFGNPFGDRGLSMISIFSVSAVFVALVMAMLCANVALMMFARAATRESEIVVRSALGASRARIVGQLFAEAAALATVAIAVGLFGATWGVRWVWSIIERIANIAGARWSGIDLSLTDTTITAGIALAFVGAAVAGILPGLRLTHRQDGVALQRHAGRGTAVHLSGVWSGILVTQVALTCMFLPVAGLAGRLMLIARRSDPGLSVSEYLTATLEMDGDAVQVESFGPLYEASYAALAERLEDEPGVTGVTIAENFPGFSHRQWRVDVEDPPPSALAEPGERAQIAAVDRTFFEVMGADFVAGRAFGAGDFDGDTRAVIVNEAFVDRFIGGRSAVGRRLRYRTSAGGFFYGPAEGSTPLERFEIVGVIRDIAMFGDPTRLHNAGIYHPLHPDDFYPLRIAVHVPSGPADFVPQLRVAARDVAPTLRLLRPVSLDRANEANQLSLDAWFRVLALVGGFAILLTNAGIYAIISFTVARRTREIGVRVALGADRRSVAVAVLSRMARRVSIGVAVGGTLGLALGYVLAEGTVELTAGVWGLAAVYLVGMVAICMAACAAPTRRALAIQPTEALSAEG